MAAAVEDVIAGVLKIPVGAVTDDLEFNGVPQWDSLNHVNLMLELEQVYGVTVDEEHMVELTSVRAIRQFVHEQAGSGTPGLG